MTLHAITVLGRDRPGIIAEATGKLGALGLNLEDSSMTLLRGQFAMTLVCDGVAESDQIEAALSPLTADGTLTVAVREIPLERAEDVRGTLWLLTVHGGDRPGIVSSVMAEVARVGGNITDLTTRLSDELYLLVAEIDLPAGADPGALAVSVRDVAAGLGVGATLRPSEPDEF